MTSLLETFTKLPGELPAEAIPGLVAITATHTGLGNNARSNLIKRREVPRHLALTLVDPARRHALYGVYLSRRDTPVDEVLEAVSVSPSAVCATLAQGTRHAAVLEHLSASTDLQVLRGVSKNAHSPIPAAVAAVTALVEAQAREDANAVTPDDATRPPSSVLGISYGWLKYSHAIRDEVVEAWAPTSTNLAALAAVVSARPNIDPTIATHVVSVALAAVPEDVTDLNESPLVLAVLQHLLALRASRPAAMELLAAEISRRNLRIGTISAIKELNLGDFVPTTDRKPVDDRAWRNTAKKAKAEPVAAAALLEDLTRLLGDDPEAWKVMARLSEQHTGTVRQLAEASVGIAVPAAS